MGCHHGDGQKCGIKQQEGAAAVDDLLSCQKEVEKVKPLVKDSRESLRNRSDAARRKELIQVKKTTQCQTL